eukprot:scaffold12259_cov13-Tisochrysis_lutea.AAC.1
MRKRLPSLHLAVEVRLHWIEIEMWVKGLRESLHGEGIESCVRGLTGASLIGAREGNKTCSKGLRSMPP